MSALSIRNLRKTYGSGLQALKGIDLEVEAGDFFALLGPNGAGKSTAIGVITSLINKSSGQVSVFGHDLDSDPVAAKSCIGLVPQEFNFNVFEPVAEIVINQAGYYGIDRTTARHRAESVLRQLGLWDKRGEMARSLSGGMKRRLMIARALVHQPRLLILDEPTAGVDIEIRRSMWKFLRETNAAGTTVILTTHYLEEAEQLCRNVAIINHGRIVEQGRVADLLAKLHTETLVLNLARPLGGPLPEIERINLTRIDDTTLEVEVPREAGINQVFAALSESGIEVLGLRNKSNRLEEFFMHLVESQRESAA